MDSFWRNAPLLRHLVPLVLGLISSLYFESYSALAPFGLVVALTIIVLLASLNSVWKRYNKNHYFGILSLVLFFILGTGLGFRSIESETNLPDGLSYLAVVETTPVEKANSYAVHLQIFKSQIDSLRYQSCRVRLVAYFAKENFDSQIIPGQTIRFSGYFSNDDQPLYPDQFNYGRYLRNVGISGTVYIPLGNYNLIDLDQFSLKGQLNRARGSLIEKLNSDSIPIREYGVIAALLMGDRTFLDPQLRDDFADAGAVHILAVSGLHVGIIYLLFLSLLNFVLKDRARLFKFFFILSVLWGYAALTGFSPSVLRAATMFSFIATGKYHAKYVNTYNMIGASALLLLIINPRLITQVGFQLSYLAVLGIVYFHPKFYAWMIVENRILDKFWSLTCVSVAAQLATFPLSIYYFNQIPSLFMVTNLVVIPLATLILYFGVAWVVLLWLPIISDILRWITVFLAWSMNGFVETINTIPFSKLDGLYLSSLSALLLYLILALLSAFLIKPGRTNLRFLGLTVVFFAALFIYRRGHIIFQDEILIPTLGNSATCIRMVQNEIYVYAEDTVEFRKSSQRALFPHFLKKGFSNASKLHFVEVGQVHSLLQVHQGDSVNRHHHIFWNLNRGELYSNPKLGGGVEVLREEDVPLLCLDPENLTLSSIDLLPLPK